MKKHCYFNGRIIPESKASVSIFDLGLLRGYGVFDFLRTYNGKPFLFKEHFKRLKNSAKLLNLKNPLTEKKTVEIIKKLLSVNKLQEATIKIVLTGGYSQDGITCDFNNPTCIIITKGIKKCPDEAYQKGVKLLTLEHQRNNAQAKTTDYIALLSHQQEKTKKQAFEILYHSKGNILEGATSNFFIFNGNVLITARENVLSGTTRNFICRLAGKKFKVEQRSIKMKELGRATEAFIASTTREIVPVTKIDNRVIGNGKVGENTKYLMEQFKKKTAEF